MSAVKILVTTDGSNLSDKAVDTAIELAEQVGGSVVGMTVVLSAAPAGGFTEEEPIVKERLEAISHKAAEIRCLAKLWSSTPRRCLRGCLLAQPESMPPIS